MPETHILEWAEKNHVAMDKQYATELREGGTRALGTNVPGVAHDFLNALPEERWRRDKEKYVYETWVKEAKARAGAMRQVGLRRLTMACSILLR